MATPTAVTKYTGLAKSVLLHLTNSPQTITIQCPSAQWILPHALLAQHADTFSKVHDDICLSDIFSADIATENAFELFIEFVLTGNWRDRGLAVNWQSPTLELDETLHEDQHDRDWRVKASICAAKLAVALKARRFHDHAMTQVYNYFYRNRNLLPPDIADFACSVAGSPLQSFVFDLVVGHWDKDSGIVDKEDEGWEEFFGKYEGLKGMLEMGQSKNGSLRVRWYMLGEPGENEF